MSHAKGKMTIKEYGGYDSIYLDGKCMCSAVNKDISNRIIACWNSHDALLAACKYNQRLLTENIGQATHAIALNEAAIAKARG